MRFNNKFSMPRKINISEIKKIIIKYLQILMIKQKTYNNLNIYFYLLRKVEHEKNQDYNKRC